MLETARALRDHGVRVRVISMHEPGSRAYEMIDDIEVIRPRYVWPERLELVERAAERVIKSQGHAPVLVSGSGAGDCPSPQ